MSRDLQPNHVKKFVNILHLVLQISKIFAFTGWELTRAKVHEQNEAVQPCSSCWAGRAPRGGAALAVALRVRKAKKKGNCESAIEVKPPVMHGRWIAPRTLPLYDFGAGRECRRKTSPSRKLCRFCPSQNHALFLAGTCCVRCGRRAAPEPEAARGEALSSVGY